MKIYSTVYNNHRKKSTTFCMLVLFIISFKLSYGQKPAEKNVDKLSPTLQAQILIKKPPADQMYTIATTNLKQFKAHIQSNPFIKLISEYEPVEIAVISCNWFEVEKLASHPLVQFIDSRKKATEELLFGFVDYAANKISSIQNDFPALNGNTVHISIKEQRFDTTDIDFKGRILPSAFASTTSSAHASIMATMCGGGGNSWYNTKGAAWRSLLSPASFQNLLPEPDTYYQSSGILVQNHSYGTVIENYYGAEAAGYDASVVNNKSLIHIFSAGNSGTLSSTTGRYAGIPGYANLTGNFKQAKNIITVGHTDSFGIVLAPSSKGPAFDGRVKPELVAFGEDGSSGAAALVSGVAAVLHQTFRVSNSGTTAPASLIKAVLLNSADDVDAKGIDFKSGYGNMNAYKAVQTILKGNYFTGAVVNNTSQQMNIAVPAGIKQLKVTLAWTDPQAAVNASVALVNDLDLTVTHTATNTTYRPWVLNSTPNINQLQELPVRKRDSINVVEQITVDLPEPGNYILHVNGFTIASGAQNFSIAYQTDSSNTFKWYFPVAADHLTAGETTVLRFESGYTSAAGILEMSTDNGNSWQQIAATVDVSKSYYKMSVPDVYSKALLRMKINSEVYTTDTFTISKRINTQVGFNCADSFLISWNKVSAATAYQINRLGNQYMEPFFITTDTFAVISKNASPPKHYSISPMLNSKAAVSSYTFNYELQGTGCYVKNLLANLNLSNNGLLQLEIGTTYRIKSISFEKQSAAGFVLLEKQTTINGLQYQAVDIKVRPGVNIYRAVIELSDGSLIYSAPAQLYFIGSKPAVIYPNPVMRNGSVTVLAEQSDALIFQLIDNYGRVVLQQLIKDSPQQISLNGMAKGIYYYRLAKDNKLIQTGSLLIL